MLEVKKYFDKAGGFSLLKQYWRAGVLCPAVMQFFLLGRNKKALELLRMTVSLKIQQRLERKYGRVLENFKYDDSIEHVTAKKVWVFWWQGISNAPALVQRCYKSVKDNLADWEIVLITQDNYQQYVELPDYILQKLNKC